MILYWIKTKWIAILNLILHPLHNHLVLYHLDNREKEDNKVKVNIGSGDWECKGWINLDYPSEWYHKMQKKHKIVAYDIRNDQLPFEKESVDVIYCSHVIEHIENEHIQNMFNNCYNVLKMGGVIRLACPDAEFLYQVSKTKTDYWKWRDDWFRMNGKNSEMTEINYLLREIATKRVKDSVDLKEYEQAYNTMEMNEFLEFATSGLKFDVTRPGDHINYFTFDKLKMMLERAGFQFVIRSKYMGSCSSEMNNFLKFDLTYPQMSLYVEAIK